MKKYMKVLSVVFVLIFAGISYGTNYYVATNGNNGNNGRTQGNAWRTISHAVENVNGNQGNPAIIIVAAGTYNRNHEGSFPIEIPDDAGFVEIRGAGQGQTIIECSGAPNWDEYTAFLAENLDNLVIRDLSIRGARGGVEIENHTFNASFINLTLEDFVPFPDGSGMPAFYLKDVDGNATWQNVEIDSATADQDGGGIYAENFEGNLSFENITFNKVTAKWGDGGAIWAKNIGGNVSISNAELTQSNSVDKGGAFYFENVDGNLDINGFNASTPNARFEDGGALYAKGIGGFVSVRNGVITSPRADDDGGLFYFENVDLYVDVRNFEVTNSQAQYGDGGVIYLKGVDGEVHVADVNVDGSYANDKGGAFYFENVGDSLAIGSCDIANIEADNDDGGAIYIKGVDSGAELNNLSFDNVVSSESGGAVYFENVDGDVVMDNITAENVENVYGEGGAFYCKNLDGEFRLTNAEFEDIYSGNNGGAIYIKDLNDSLVVENFILDGTHCEWENGGGFYLENLDNGIRFNGVTIRDGFAEESGGGIYLKGLQGDAYLTSVAVEECEVNWGHGGGIFWDNMNHADSLIFENFSLCGNQGNEDSEGGGLYMDLKNDEVGVRFSEFSVINNSSGQWGDGGGGMYLYKIRNLLMTEGTFKGNENGADNTTNDKDGGAVYFHQVRNIDLRNIVFWGNTSRGNGGAFTAYKVNDSFNIFNCVFMNNIAVKQNNNNKGEGGAIYFEESNADNGPDYLIRNVLFANNHAERVGGAIFLRKGDIDIVNVTMARNNADDEMETIFARNNNASARVYNSIIWGNGNTDGRSTTYSEDEIDFFYCDVENEGGDVVDGPGNKNINPIYFRPGSRRFDVRMGSRTIDAGMPDDDQAEGYVEAYADYSHEAAPNYERINMGFWGATTGACLICDHCDGDGDLVSAPPGGAGGGVNGGAPPDDAIGFGGGDGGTGTSEARLVVLRDKYIFMGVPVIPSDEQLESDPSSTLGDDMEETQPQWGPDFEDQTWRFSRWTEHYEHPNFPNGGYTGYLRWNQEEGGGAGEVDDPPLITPGRGYWFVYNLGARFESNIEVDAPRFMMNAEDHIMQLQSWDGTGNPALNMMANPWPFPIDWADVEFSIDQETWISSEEASQPPYEWINGYAYTWDHLNGYYVPKNRTLNVWEGFWIAVYTQEDLWIKFPPQISEEDEETVTLDTHELDEILDWSLLLTARRTDQLQVDYHNWIGVGEGLSNLKDQYDAFQLSPQAREAIMLRTRVYDDDINQYTDRLTYDFRANDLEPGIAKTWLIEVLFYVDDPAVDEAYPIDVKIRWPNISGIPSNVDLSIHPFNNGQFDQANPIIADMRQADEYVMEVGNTIGGFPEYRIGRFWLAATLEGNLLDSPSEGDLLPRETRLASVSPNPFNNATTIRYEIATKTNVSLKLFNVLGQEVIKLLDGKIEPGYHALQLNGAKLGSGVYFIRFESDVTAPMMKKVVMIK
ncbi:T9SS type A sorting domain-containing protein [bacterium]|nr:T9SS type A sorting domain-containing protein [bacterium]